MPAAVILLFSFVLCDFLVWLMLHSIYFHWCFSMFFLFLIDAVFHLFISWWMFYLYCLFFHWCFIFIYYIFNFDVYLIYFFVDALFLFITYLICWWIDFFLFSHLFDVLFLPSFSFFLFYVVPFFTPSEWFTTM